MTALMQTLGHQERYVNVLRHWIKNQSCNIFVSRYLGVSELAKDRHIIYASVVGRLGQTSIRYMLLIYAIGRRML
jgi:hypothetical protein